VLVVRRVPLALVAAGATCDRTRFDRRPEDAAISFRLTRQNLTRADADVTAVEAQADATDHLLHIRLDEICVRTTRASPGARDALVDAAHEQVEVDVRRPRMGLHDVSNRHGRYRLTVAIPASS
jgi:hypothetical protein